MCCWSTNDCCWWCYSSWEFVDYRSSSLDCCSQCSSYKCWLDAVERLRYCCLTSELPIANWMCCWSMKYCWNAAMDLPMRRAFVHLKIRENWSLISQSQLSVSFNVSEERQIIESLTTRLFMGRDRCGETMNRKHFAKNKEKFVSLSLGIFTLVIGQPMDRKWPKIRKFSATNQNN